MRQLKDTTRTDEGFTILEVMVVALIIGILSLIAIATFTAATGSANAAACRENQDTFTKAISVAVASDTPPDELEDLRPYVKNYDGICTCPEDGTPLAFDPATNTVSCPNHP